ncbi:MAG TPA: dihydrolipoamide acetyltransferase family protein [Tepidiformaceae bacterium]
MSTVTMPQLGESVTEGTILKWFKRPGDFVALDEPLCEIETEKVTAELPSPFEGTMGEILVEEGAVAPIGAPLCEVGEKAAVGATAGEQQAAAEKPEGRGWSGGPMAIPPDEDMPSGNGALKAEPVPMPARPASRMSPEDRSRYYSPAVMRLAEEHGIDLQSVTGTGIGGRITRKDVEAAVATPAPAQEAATAAPTVAPERAPAAAPEPAGTYEVVQLSATRRTIAANLKRSNLEAPQAWTMVEADVTGLVNLRAREKEQFARDEGIDLTLLPYFTAAVCEALREYPMLNARWEGEELRRYRPLNIGIAVATDHGLLVPVIHEAGDLSVAGLAKRISDLATRAHARKLRVEDIEGGTFTVNNTGSFGSIASKPIVNHPEVGIVSMERVVRRPVVLDGDSIAIRSMVNVCLSFDHRALDGYEAGGFLSALKKALEAYG